MTEGIYAKDEVLAGIRNAMVLCSLMGYGDSSLTNLMKNRKFRADEILYVGLQGLHDSLFTD